MMRDIVKNRTKCDTDLPIGQERKSIWITKGTGNSFGNGRKVFLANLDPELTHTVRRKNGTGGRAAWIAP
jgi:hypothetical protein